MLEGTVAISSKTRFTRRFSLVSVAFCSELKVRRNLDWAVPSHGSTLEAIRANPTNDQFDFVRNTFESTYPEAIAQRLLVSFEHLVADSGECRVQQYTIWLTNRVRRSLASRLVGILLDLLTALLFLPRWGKPLSAGTIALLYARPSSNQTEFKHTA